MKQLNPAIKLFRLPVAIFLFVFGFNTTVKAQTGIPVDPALQYIDDTITNWMNHYGCPGGTLAVAQNGKIIFLRGYGTSDSAHTVAMQPYNIMRIASVSKVITWAAILKLENDGLVNADDLVFDPTSGILGQESYVTGSYTDSRINQITIQDLLDMEGGWDAGDSTCFPDPVPVYLYSGPPSCDPISYPLAVTQMLGVSNPVSRQDYVKFLLNRGLDHDPGTYYSYLNIGFTMLGLVIEKVTGMSYEQYIDSVFNNPLGICDMHLAKNLHSEAQEREAYYNDPYITLSCYGTGQVVPWQYGGRQTEAMDAHGGWISTSRDLIRFFWQIQTILGSEAYANVPTSWGGAFEGTNATWGNLGTYQWMMIVNKRMDYLSAQISADIFGNLPNYCIDNITTTPSYDLGAVPSANSDNITFTNVQPDSFAMSWTPGNGTARLLVASAGAPISSFPLDATDYTANSTFGAGADLGGGNYVVYNGSGNNVTVTGLTPGVNYYFRLFEYNNNTTTGNYSLYTLCECGMAEMSSGPTVASVSPDSLCAGSELTVNYITYSNTYNNGNTYTIQLSDSSGGFASPVSVGSISSASTNGSVSCTIPSNAAGGSAYRVRIVSNNPAYTGAEDTNNITVSPMLTWYRDADGDGFGNPSVSQQSCTQPVGYVLNNFDCNDNNASVNPKTQEIVDGIDNNCNGAIDENSGLNFDGVDDYVQLSYFNRPDTMTVEFWLKTTSVVAQNEDILSWAAAIPNLSTSEIILYNGGIAYSEAGNGQQFENSGGFVADGNWHHIAVVHNGDGPNNVLIYSDSTLILQISMNQTANTACLGLGYLNSTGSDAYPAPQNFFNGTIDELRVYSEARSLSQIITDMTTCADMGPAANLLCYYDFNQGVPNGDNANWTSIYDYSGNNGVGTLQNFSLTGTSSNYVPGHALPVWYRDADGDGFGNSDDSIVGCQQAGYVAIGGDCDDNNPNINPAAQEIVDGIDNNCNGAIDENSGLNFDGVDDNVQVTGFAMPDNMTAEVWVQTTSTAAQQEDIISWVGSSPVFTSAELYIYNGNLYFLEAVNGGGENLGAYSIADGNWHHIALAITDAGSSIQIYVDGVLRISGSMNLSLATTNVGFGSIDYNVNNSNPYPGNFFNGTIDELRVYGEVRSASQIQSDMICSDMGPAPNLLCYYDFNQGVPNSNNADYATIYEYSGNHGKGTLHNFALNGTSSNFVPGHPFPIWYQDLDGDGFGNSDVFVQKCPQPAGYVAVGGDCDDTNPNINPAAQEIVDGVDNNCNGAIDENSGLNFDGVDDNVQVTPIAHPDSMTAEFWINTSSNAAQQEDILAWIGYTPDQNVAELYMNGGNLFYIEVFNGGGENFGAYHIADGNWHHIALVRSGDNNPNNIQIYIDGILRINNTTTISLNTTNFDIGNIDWNANNSNPAPDRFFNGTIDELRVYSEARTSSQIQADMTCGDMGPASNLLCYYDFNQGVPNSNNADFATIYEYSGNHGSGVLHNFALNGTSSNFVNGHPFNRTIAINGDGVSIPIGEASPSDTNYTDYGTVGVGVSSAHTFSVHDTGTGSLVVSSISVTGANETEFTVSGISLPATIPAGDTAVFTVTFNPSASGLRSAVIHVNNTDCLEYNYTFNVQGTGNSGIWTWTGADNNSNWNDPLNWSGGVPVSGCAANVIIQDETYEPVLSGNTTLGSVQLDAGADLSIGNGIILSVCGAWTGSNNSSVTGTGVVQLNGSSAQTLTGSTQFYELLINNPNGVALAANAAVSIYNALDLQSGEFNVAPGTITFLSTSVSQCAIIDNFSNTFGNYSGTLSGSVKAQRYYGAPYAGFYNQRLLGSPVDGIAFSQFGAAGTAGYLQEAADGCDEAKIASGSPWSTVLMLDETHGATCTTDQWYAEVAGNSPNDAQGYAVTMNGEGTLTVHGNANLSASYANNGITNSAWPVTTTIQGHTVSPGWHIASNPYLAPLNLTSVGTVGMDQQVAVWYTSGEFAGSYQSTVISVEAPAAIAPFQAFMVHVTSTGVPTTGDLVINGTDRSRIIVPTFYNTGANTLTVKAQNTVTGLSDQTVVGFNAEASAGFDPSRDANKPSGSLNRQTLYTTATNPDEWLGVNYQQTIDQTPTVAMGFEPGSTDNAASYNMSFNGVNTFDPTVYIYLEDKQLNTPWWNLRNGNYSYTANATDTWQRFVLHFTPPAQISTVEGGCISLGAINITQPGPANWNYTIVNSSNTQIASGVLNQSAPIAVNAAAGTYTLTLVDNSGYTVTKLIEVGGAQPVTAGIGLPAASVPAQTAVTFTSTSQNATNFSWNFGDGVMADIANPVHTYTSPGAYVVSLTVANAANCTATTNQNITVTGIATGLNNPGNNQGLNMWSNENTVYVDFSNISKVDATIKIYDVLGREISSDRFTNSTIYEKRFDNLEVAFVLVSVKMNDQVVTKKLFINNIK